jgi:glycosyltransferase involved in cell wall biosynthesis
MPSIPRDPASHPSRHGLYFSTRCAGSSRISHVFLANVLHVVTFCYIALTTWKPRLPRMRKHARANAHAKAICGNLRQFPLVPGTPAVGRLFDFARFSAPFLPESMLFRRFPLAPRSPELALTPEGAEERLPDYYAAADCFVLPTRCLEGFGLVTVEALACGTPVLGTPIGGTQEILRKLDPAFLFDSAGSEALAQRLLQRLPELYQNSPARERCRAFAEKEYSWNALVPRLEKLMQSVAGASVDFGQDIKKATSLTATAPGAPRHS